MKKRWFVGAAAAAGLLALAGATSANDVCSAAVPISCGDIMSGTTIGATWDAMPACGTTNTTNGVWFRLTGNGDEVTVTTCHSSSNYDTKLGVWSGSCDNLACVGGNDDAACAFSGLRSEVTFQTVAGVDYFILVHGFSANAGSFGLIATCAAPPPPLANDDCADAIAMTEGVSYFGDNRGSTLDGPTACGAAAAPDVWYTFTAGATATAQFSLCDSAYDTVLSVYDGCPSAGGSQVACNDDFCGLRSQVAVPMTGGQTYWIRVGGDGASGQFSLRADLFAPDANDACAGALPLEEGQLVSGDTRGNTAGSAAPSCAGNLAPDVWYSFQPSQDRTARFSLCGSSFDTVLSLYDGCPDSGGTEIACNDNLCGSQSELTADVVNGQTYYLRVTGDGAEGPFALQITTFEPGTLGPDVIYADCSDVWNWGAVDGTNGYSLASLTCNMGNENMIWNGGTGSPWLAMNAYRLHEGRLEQIGLSFCKAACCAAASTGCGPCNGFGGQQLGVGCSDSYSSNYNGGHSRLGPRSGINAFTGAIAYDDSTSGNAIHKRLQVQQSDMSSGNYPGALYFVEGVYVGIDDAPAGKGLNNASYKRVNITQGTWEMNVTGAMHRERAAIFAWRDHGLGADNPDTNVNIVEADVPGEGRFYVGAKVADNGNGTWRYEYAVYNLNSDRSGGSFSVPLPAGTTVTNIGFHDVDYHSGEPYDNSDWRATETTGAITWNSPQPHSANPNSNALRWGTMYNFWFDADRPPADGVVELGLFKPGTPTSITAAVAVPTSSCMCELDGQAGVDVFDLLAYLDLWFDSDAAADIDAAAGVDVFDLLMYLDCWFNAADGSCA